MGRHVVGWLAAAALLCAIGCARQSSVVALFPNQRPTVELVGSPPDTTGRVSYRLTLHWTGFDPDGQVAYFLYAIDPPASGDTTWVKTERNQGEFEFATTRVDSAAFGQANTATELHTFVIKAVDLQGLPSAPEWRSFNAFTIAPQIHIVSPPPNEFVVLRVSPSVTIQWSAFDPDGVPNQSPVAYKFKIWNRADFPYFPDLSQINQLGPAFAGWDSVAGDQDFTFYGDLTLDQQFVFVVTALDRAGAWDPVFSLKTNVIIIRPTYANVLGPTISFFNEYFRYTYPSGGYSRDDSRVVRIEVPAQTAIRIGYSATPREGARVSRFRWAVDIADLDDPSPRVDESLDVTHWSQWSATQNSALVPLSALQPGTGESHMFYLEVEDNTHLKSLGMVEMRTIPFTHQRDALIVDDRRGFPDRYVNGHVYPPVGAWPSEAELDTFFFARGGFPWTGYGPENGLPEQLMSPPGVFLGYDFDTLDTRSVLQPAPPLSVLARYRDIIWYVDLASAELAAPFTDPYNPMTALRSYTGPGGFNPLAAYQTYGGGLMLFGGGIVSATMRAWGDVDVNYETGGPYASLVPGRYPYDALHMRADMRTGWAERINASDRRPAAFAGLPDLQLSYGHDPLPPLRGNVPHSPWTEYLTKPLEVIEDYDPSPGGENWVSTLDTLYQAAGGIVVGPAPCGFYYHGHDNGPVVFLGFDLWTWRRAQIIQLVDVLLQGPLGLTREPLPR